MDGWREGGRGGREVLKFVRSDPPILSQPRK